MRSTKVCTLSLSALLALSACGDGAGPAGSGGTRYDPPNTEFAAELGLRPPVTSEQAMAIAAAATGGTALSVDQETEGGELLFEVQVETADGRREVEVRASDGGVVEIEAADDEREGEDGDD
jgi:uncharacterized membrane protein YkoI